MSRIVRRARRVHLPVPRAVIAAVALALTGACLVPSAQAAPGPLALVGTNAVGYQGSAGDFNGDGKDDSLYLSAGPTVTVLYGASPTQTGLDPTKDLGTRAVSFTTPSGSTLEGAASAGDVDHDGFDDIIVITDTADYIVYGSASGAGTKTALAAGVPGVTVVTPRPLGSTFGATTISNGQQWAPSTYGIGDFNGDGYDDVMVQGGAGASIVYGGPRVASINAGAQGTRVSLIDGTHICAVVFYVLKTCLYDPVNGFAAGDFNGDGKDDLVVYPSSGAPQLFLGRTGSFHAAANAVVAPAVTLADAASAFSTNPGLQSGVGDVNGYGLDDLAFTNGTIVLGRRNPPATIPASDPVVKIGSSSETAAGYSPGFETIGVGDQNGDGKDDLLVFSSFTTPKLVTAVPAAGGTVDIDSRPTITGLPSGLQPNHTASDVDIDGDGAKDAVLSDTSQTYLLTHQASTIGTQPDSYPTSLTSPGWSNLIGQAAPSGAVLQLTNGPQQWNTWSWQSPGDYRAKTISFDVNMAAAQGGTGGEGMTLALVAPASDGTFPLPVVGNGGNRLGFDGFQGLALGLDVLQGDGDPTANEVGLTDGGTGDALHWLRVAPSPVPLYGAGTVHVTLEFKSGVAAIYINGQFMRSSGRYTPPASSYLTFTAATSSLPSDQVTTISNLSITDS